MKKYIHKSFIIIIALTLLFINGCTNLDVPVVSEITPDTFPKTTADYIAAEGPIFIKLANSYMLSYWFLQECSADGMVLTANGGNWYDSARYKNFHLHTWTYDERFINEAWTMAFGGVSLCNSILQLFKEAEDSDAKTVGIAEIRTMRALFYFMLMDLYGGVPLVTTFGTDTEEGARVSRTEIFNFIESELKEVLPDLSSTTGSATYGRPTQWTAYAILAKMYLNSEIYTGTSRYDDAVTMCDAIITEATTNGKIGLDSDYLAMFYPSNGPTVKDFLFAIPYDGVNLLNSYPARYWLHKLLKTKYGLSFTPSGCLRTWPEFYSKFTIDKTDVRQKMWLTGIQYNTDGTPITVKTTNKGLDSRYSGSEPNAAVTYTLNFTPEVEFRNVGTFETGDDYNGWAVGYRCNKYYPDNTVTTRNQSNDIPLFRYADVLLMKAEAILRGATATMGQTPLSLVNMVRSRAKATQFTSIDLEGLLDERARELCFECWRRNDLIRFGKWEGSWGVKTDADVNHRLYPIPSTAIDANSLLEQNPGY